MSFRVRGRSVLPFVFSLFLSFFFQEAFSSSQEEVEYVALESQKFQRVSSQSKMQKAEEQSVSAESDEEEERSSHPPQRPQTRNSKGKSPEGRGGGASSYRKSGYHLISPEAYGPEGMKLKHFVTYLPSEEEKKGATIIQNVGVISQTLKMVQFSILQEKEEVKVPTPRSAEGAEWSDHELEEAGDLRNGMFIILESLKRPHRYHGRFFHFNEAKYTEVSKALHKNPDDHVFLTEDVSMTPLLKKMFRTDPLVDIRLEACLLTRSTPNRLFLSLEEVDLRCCGRVEDFFGTIYSHFENDPMAVVALLAGGASRVAKAALTSGGSELAGLFSE